jgi:hypothetical protein
VKPAMYFLICQIRRNTKIVVPPGAFIYESPRGRILLDIMWQLG